MGDKLPHTSLNRINVKQTSALSRLYKLAQALSFNHLYICTLYVNQLEYTILFWDIFLSFLLLSNTEVVDQSTTSSALSKEPVVHYMVSAAEGYQPRDLQRPQTALDLSGTPIRKTRV